MKPAAPYIHNGRSSEKPPILLIHGAYNRGQIWKNNFYAHFDHIGHEVVALHLKDQGTVDRWRTLFAYGLDDYVNRLHDCISQLDRPPFLIGHSMGGLVVQKYLGQHPGKALGACLLASLPYFGMKHTLKKMVLQPSILFKYFMLTLNPRVGQRNPSPPGLLSDRVKPENRLELKHNLQRESARALLDCLRPGVELERVRQHPLLIFSAGLDNLALPEDVARMGQVYQREVKHYSQAGHFLMLEPEAEEIATLIESFVNRIQKVK